MTSLRPALVLGMVVVAVCWSPALITGQEEGEMVEAPGARASDEAAVVEPATSEAEEEPPKDIERITFSLPFSAESGGGSATGSAGTLNYLSEDLVVASDAVEVRYQNLTFQAETVSVDLATKQITGEGRVVVDEGPRRIVGQRVEFDLEKRTGTFFEAQAFVDPDIQFEGEEITKVEDDVYMIKNGTMTSCSEDEVPDWSFRLGKGRVKVDGFARVKNTTMRAKKVPVLYLPYLLFPAKSGRTPGFLFPNLGYSSSKGEVFGLAYFQPFGDSYDATLFADLYSEDYTGLGTEFRYAPSAATNGTLRAHAIDDPITDEVRWKASWWHSSKQLPFGMRGVVSYRDFSDFEFFRDFERNFNDVSLRTLYSNAFVAGSWGSHSLNILADQRETFIRSGTFVNMRQLPEVEYRLRPTQLGKWPVYLGLLSSFNLFEVSRTNVLENSYARADLLPTVTVPVSTLPWLSFSVTASGRATWYEDSLTADRRAFSGESLTRTFPSASAGLIGPSFSKVFDKKAGRFGKFKHIIEPRWDYLFIDEFDDQSLVPLFDEVDRLINRETVRFSLVNRVLAKPADEASLEGAREIFLFELAQAFSLRDDQPFERSSDSTLSSKKSPITARMRFNPSNRTSLEARTTYSDLFGRVSAASLLGGVRFGDQSVGLTWLTSVDPELGTTRNHQARLFTDLTLVKNHLRMQNQVNLNLLNGDIQQHRHVFYYTSQCYGIRLEYRELETATLRDRDIRFALSLKNIGTFLDLNSGGRETF